MVEMPKFMGALVHPEKNSPIDKIREYVNSDQFEEDMKNSPNGGGVRLGVGEDGVQSCKFVGMNPEVMNHLVNSENICDSERKTLEDIRDILLLSTLMKLRESKSGWKDTDPMVIVRNKIACIVEKGAVDVAQQQNLEEKHE